MKPAAASDIQCKPWTKVSPPRRILAIRLQAMGDVVITLPYLQGLRNALPTGVRLDFLTREETEDIPKNIDLFDRVFTIGGGRNASSCCTLSCCCRDCCCRGTTSSSICRIVLSVQLFEEHCFPPPGAGLIASLHGLRESETD